MGEPSGVSVMKFGGTSVTDAAAIEQLTRIVGAERARGASPIVVVSAMAGVTDRLLGLARGAMQGRTTEVASGLAELRDRHADATRRLLHQPTLDEALAWLADEARRLESLLSAVAVLGEATPRSLDAIAACGELLSSRIVALALRSAELDAEWIDARQVIVTDAAHTCAAPLAEEIAARVADAVLPALGRGRVPVLAGYIGATADGVTTTLGRGGSDYSAAILGAGVHDAAQGSGRAVPVQIQIWTDVDGMLTADPRVVTGAVPVPRLSFGEASELAYFGAKVLHPSTILPAVERDIPVRILNSRRPGAEGTLIAAAPPDDVRPLAALACKRHITVIEVTSTRMLMAHGFLRRLFEIFERRGTAVDVVTTSEVSVSVTVDDDRQLDAIVADLRAFAEVSVERGMAILCMVGDGLRRDRTLAIHLLALLEGIPLRMVSQAASRRNLTVVLDEAHLAGAMERLHSKLFTGAAGGVSR